MLTGPELLAKVKELGQAPRDQIAIACGYVNKAGKPAFTAFFEALNAAHGLSLAPVAAKPKRGKPLSWSIKPSKSGALVVAAGYGNLLGVTETDTVTIEHTGDALVLRKAPPAACEAPAAIPVVVTAQPVPVAAPEPAAAPVRELAPF